MTGRVLIATVAALCLAACGGDGDGGGDTPAEVRSCLAAKRYPAAAGAADPLLETKGQVDVRLDAGKAVVYFFASEGEAERHAFDLGTFLSAGAGGLTVRERAVVVAYPRPPKRADRDAIEGCIA